jgi:predicted GH43/DUF377 family glycosyl hydrolase
VTEPDPIPPLVSQARAHNWRAGQFDFKKALRPGITYLNCAFVERDDGLWLITRQSEDRVGMPFGFNSLWAFKISEDDLQPLFGKHMIFQGARDMEQFEDGRPMFFNGQTWISCCNFIWFPDGSWTGAHQTIGVFDSDWNCMWRHNPEIGGNEESVETKVTGPKHEKNWVFWIHNGRLHLLYSQEPWLVIEFGNKWFERTNHRGNRYGVKYDYGLIRGGTPPILHDGFYWTFFHSSLPWEGRLRRYFMGAIGFKPEPPFTPVRYTVKPLLIGSRNDTWAPNKPLVVFPCGAVLRGDKWLISYGINDLTCGWVEIPHFDLYQRTVPVPNYCRELMLYPDWFKPAMSSNNGEKTNTDLTQRRREHAAKIRQILAEKRARGEVTIKRRRKRKRIARRRVRA